MGRTTAILSRTTGATAASLARLLRSVRATGRSGDIRAKEQLDWLQQGRVFAESWPLPTSRGVGSTAENPLRAFFEARREGHGIWKWDHYFDIYHRHFARFRGSEVHVLEIGIYSGGSLEMWADYFGPRCRLYGVDVEEACREYEGGSTRVFIGDQGDRAFWWRFRKEVPRLDVVIDDGGHRSIQQAVTLEELLPHLSPGGVYLCEDVHGSLNRFGGYAAGLIQAMNASVTTEDFEDPERRSVCRASGFQAVVESIHCYPFVTVLEKRPDPVAELRSRKHGTQWEPFLS
jgi:hypothetical protein